MELAIGGRLMNYPRHPVVTTMLVITLVSCGCPLFTTKTQAQLSDLTLIDFSASGGSVIQPRCGSLQPPEGGGGAPG
jgi:hypothetical protein